MQLHTLYYFCKKRPLLALALGSGILFCLTALLYVTLGAPASGDEPHYLVISQTLLKYHSLNVMADYTHGDYRSFYPIPLDPHITINARRQVMPLHSIGGPVLWLIPFLLGGRLGVVEFMALITALIVLAIYQFLRTMGISARVAFLVSLGYAIASPLYIYSYRSFIEPLGSLICIYVLWQFFTTQLSRSALLISSTLLGLLPWIHTRFVLLEIPLFLVLLFRIYQKQRLRGYKEYLYYLLPIVLLSLSLEIYSYVAWGTLNPAANQINGNSKPFEVSPFVGLLGVFFDQKHGLLLSFPIGIFGLAGILLSAKRKYLAYHLLLLILAVPYIVAFTSFRHWGGGWSPPARFILVLLPLCSFYIAYALEHTHTLFTRLLFPAALCWGFIFNILVMLPPQYGFEQESGPDSIIAPIHIFDVYLTNYVPTVYKSDQFWLFVVWIALYIAITLLLFFSTRMKAQNETVTNVL